MAEPFDASLPTVGQKPWSLNPAVTEIRGRLGGVEDFVSGPGLEAAIQEAAENLPIAEVDDAIVAGKIADPASATNASLVDQVEDSASPVGSALTAKIATPVAKAQRYSSMRGARPGDAFPPVMYEEPTVAFMSTPATYASRKIWPVLNSARWWGFPVIGSSVTYAAPDGASYNCYRSVHAGGQTPDPAYWEWLTDAPLFEVSGNFHSGSPIWVEIDGRALASGAKTPSNSNLRFTFPTSAVRKMRRIRIYGGDGMQPAVIMTNVTDTVMPTPTTRPRLGIMTDSYGQGSVASGQRPYAIPYVFGELLGVDNVKSSVGGTGYQTGNGPTSTFLARVPEFDGVAVSAMLWMGGINDSVTGLQAAAEACYAAFRAAHPNTPQVAMGPWSPRGSYETDNAAKWTAIQAACVAQGVTFIDNRGWVTGSGNIGTPAGDGNADIIISSDGTHPSTSSANPTNGLGSTILATRLFSEFSSRINSGEIS